MLPHNQKYICLDTETTGLNLSYSEAWQVSWIVCEGKRVVDVHDRFPNVENLQLSEGAARVTGFDRSVYNSKKEPLKNVWGDLKKYLYDPDYLIIGQNLLGYDVYILRALALKLGEEPDFSYMDRILDTRPLGKAVRENIQKPAGNIDMLSWQYKMMNDRSLKAKVSQLQLLKYFSIDFDKDKLHDGLYDVTKSFEIFLAIKKALKL